MNIVTVRNNVLERLEEKHSGTFIWRNDISYNPEKWYLFYRHPHNREDFGGIPDDSWDEFERNFKCECVMITPTLLDDLASYKVDVEDVIMRYAEWSIELKKTNGLWI